MRTTLLLILTLAAAATAETMLSVSETNRFAWGENIGWVNFGGPTNADPATITIMPDGSGYLEGFAWAENVGWIKLGNDFGGPYANSDGANHGVNFDTAGVASGYAWGENIGWVNFDTADASRPADDHARVEMISNGSYQLRGYAWGENVGWINLNDDTVFVAFGECPADLDPPGGDGELGFFDLVAYLTLFAAMDPAADLDPAGGDGAFGFFDLVAYLTLFAAGCP